MAHLTVMTWNVQNPFVPTSVADQSADSAKPDQLGSVIDWVAPDVLPLQEVGDSHVLPDLNEHCSIDFDHRVTGRPDSRGIRVALLSPRRLSNITHRQSFPAQVDPV